MADPGGSSALAASLVQEVWLGGEPRLRGRRLAPFETPAVRLVFHPDRGATLDDAPLRDFLEAMGARVDIVAFEPRGQGGSSGRFGPEVLEDLREVVSSVERRWPDGLPLVVAGHGLGGSLALAVADHPAVRGAAALAPLVPPFAEDATRGLVESLDLARSVPSLALPLLFLVPRDGRLPDASALAAAQPRATLVTFPGDHVAPLSAPWPRILAAWAAWAVARR